MISVYFIKPVGMEGPIKIGASISPRDRLREVMEVSPIPLEIVLFFPGSYALEKNIHECFADAHSHREWFHPIPRLIAAIEALKGGAAPHEAIDLSARIGSIHALKLADARRRRGTAQQTVSQ